MYHGFHKNEDVKYVSNFSQYIFYDILSLFGLIQKICNTVFVSDHSAVLSDRENCSNLDLVILATNLAFLHLFNAFFKTVYRQKCQKGFKRDRWGPRSSTCVLILTALTPQKVQQLSKFTPSSAVCYYRRKSCSFVRNAAFKRPSPVQWGLMPLSMWSEVHPTNAILAPSPHGTNNTYRGTRLLTTVLHPR